MKAAKKYTDVQSNEEIGDDLFELPDHDDALQRYHDQAARWDQLAIIRDHVLGPLPIPRKKLYRLKHRMLWVIHNCVAAPIVGVFPNKTTSMIHGWTKEHLDPMDE